jgi:hypothetical protein
MTLEEANSRPYLVGDIWVYDMQGVAGSGITYYLILDQRVKEKEDKKGLYVIFYDLMDLSDGKLYPDYRMIMDGSIDAFPNWKKVA